ncbi:MAG: DUF4136 domain-containing protein [Thermoanaerobaculia bacterium]
MRRLLLVATCSIFACVEVTEFANIRPAVLQTEPLVSSYLDPGSDLAKYETFAAFPYSAIGQADGMNPIMEKQLLFFVRSQLELRGYKFVSLQDDPDFLITTSVKSTFSEVHIPPQQVSVPVWKPGTIITTQLASSGTLAVNLPGEPGTWGTYSGQTSVATYVPGHRTTETRTEPGYSVGRWYPSAAVWVYDRRSLENVWLGIGVGTSENQDARVSAQFVLTAILDKFPNCSTISPKSPGVLGIEYDVITTDGNMYRPVVFDVSAGSTRAAGLHKFDVITAIDGTPATNKSFGEIASLLSGEPGVPVTLQVARPGQSLNITLVRIDRAALGW